MPQTFTTRPEIRGTFGAVASTHWIASAVGFGVLERGGNAFDAAVATGLTLQIVEPHLNGPGGEVPILVHVAGEDRPKVLCGQGVALRPRRRSSGCAAWASSRMPGTGHLPAVVPGAFDAWMRLLLEHGTMRLRDVLEPAIGYARDGYPLVHRAAESIHAIAPMFRVGVDAFGRGLAAGRQAADAGPARRPAADRRHLRPHPVRGRDGARRPRSRRSRRRGTPSTAASSPRRSTPSSAPSRWTTRAGGIAGLLTGDDMARLAGRLGGDRQRATSPASRCTRPGPGARGRRC